MLLQAEHSGCGPGLVQPGSGSTLMLYVTNNIQNQTNDACSGEPQRVSASKEGTEALTGPGRPPQSLTGGPQFDRRTGRQTTGRHIAERMTRNENKPLHHRRDDRKRESQQRMIPGLKPAPPPQLWKMGSSSFLISASSAYTASVS